MSTKLHHLQSWSRLFASVPYASSLEGVGLSYSLRTSFGHHPYRNTLPTATKSFVNGFFLVPTNPPMPAIRRTILIQDLIIYDGTIEYLMGIPSPLQTKKTLTHTVQERLLSVQ